MMATEAVQTMLRAIEQMKEEAKWIREEGVNTQEIDRLLQMLWEDVKKFE